MNTRERRILEAARVARLATVDADRRPHIVPICFAVIDSAGQAVIVTPIDEKPKHGDPTDLRRVRDIKSEARVALVVDRYTEEWDRLAWLQVRGTATLRSPGVGTHQPAVDALRAKYDQYAEQDLSERPVIAIEVGHVRAWGDLNALIADP